MPPHILCSRRLPRRRTSRKGGEVRAARAIGGSSGSGGSGGSGERGGNGGSCGNGGNGGLCQSPWTLTKCGDAIIDDCES